LEIGLEGVVGLFDGVVLEDEMEESRGGVVGKGFPVAFGFVGLCHSDEAAELFGFSSILGGVEREMVFRFALLGTAGGALVGFAEEPSVTLFSVPFPKKRKLIS
jgi:hypothetical protein